ncbi:hypothetical protein ACGFYQ_30840 [Streptomyces sp. NPDC048258]|uniref:hypothetical protein n=1 Tax=Streptomyces sp. NPDC048258 TaxID=3365527 RepID=UPI0037233123
MSRTRTTKVKIQGSAGDTTGAQDMLAATLKRLEQVQDGRRATATAADTAAKADKRRVGAPRPARCRELAGWS